jgi:hypothetical protein
MSYPANNFSAPVRNRIVIPLDAKIHAVPPRRRSGGRWLLGLGVAAVLLFVVGAAIAVSAHFWWEHYKTTPAYSLALMVDAAQRDDAASVEQVIDADKVTASFSNQIVDKATARFGTAMSGPIRKQIEVLVAGAQPILRQEVRSELSKRVQKAASSTRKPFFLIAVTLPYSVKVAVEGDHATAMTGSGTTAITLDLRREGDIWKVVGLRDEELVQRAVDDILRNMPGGINNDRAIEGYLRDGLTNASGVGRTHPSQ